MDERGGRIWREGGKGEDNAARFIIIWCRLHLDFELAQWPHLNLISLSTFSLPNFRSDGQLDNAPNPQSATVPTPPRPQPWLRQLRGTGMNGQPLTDRE